MGIEKHSGLCTDVQDPNYETIIEDGSTVHVEAVMNCV